MGTTIAPAVQSTSLFIPELGPRRKEAVLQHLVAHAAGAVRDPAVVCDALAMRERLGVTALGKGVALPNVRSLGVLEPRVVVGRSTRGIDWGAADGQRVHLVLLTLSPAETPLDVHLDQVARLTSAIRLVRQRARLLEAADADAVAALLRPTP